MPLIDSGRTTTGVLMIKMPLPIITLVIIFIQSGFMLLPASIKSIFYFDRGMVEGGSLYSLLSGHFVHSDMAHWFWNSLAMLVLGVIIEIKSRRLFFVSIMLGIISVDILLLSPLSDINYYCGLSGVINTLLFVWLWLVWREGQSVWVVVASLLCMSKIIIEVLMSDSLLTTISWPAYPEAHLAGAIAGISIVLIQAYRTGSMGSKLREKTFTLFNRLT